MFKIIPFEPGDGTRYHVGITRVDADTAYELGWSKDQPCALFFFGTSSYEISNVLPIRNLVPSDFTKALQPDRESPSKYNAVAAHIVFAFLTGTEVYLPDSSSYPNVLVRWDSATQSSFRPPWRAQLEDLRRSFHLS